MKNQSNGSQFFTPLQNKVKEPCTHLHTKYSREIGSESVTEQKKRTPEEEKSIARANFLCVYLRAKRNVQRFVSLSRLNTANGIIFITFVCWYTMNSCFKSHLRNLGPKN